MRVGDIIDLPPEPPVGTVLASQDQVGQFQITRTPAGWKLVDHDGVVIQSAIYNWASAYRIWGPCSASEQPFRIVSVPEDAELNVYTVIGLRDNTSGTLIVAGVVRGEIDTVDSDPGTEDAQRWADSFTAASPDAAEAQAHADIADG